MLGTTKEHIRLAEAATEVVPPWRRWGSYVSERQWGSVREDYSENGDAWKYFPFEESHKRAYRWSEDGIAGWCDRYQILAFSPAFWNGKDPILKERLFGLASAEGNHAEDVKEYYYYLDATPSHSYMKYLYKYPQGEFPYRQLKEGNASRNTYEPEYELADTGIFANNAYFDIFIEYAKASSEDFCIRIEACNRGDKSAPLHIIPQMWFRNQWSWFNPKPKEPKITVGQAVDKTLCVIADDTEMPSPPNLAFDYHLGKRYLYGPASGEALFTNNDTARENVYGKDAFHRQIVHGEQAVNPDKIGTKSGLHYFFPSVPAHGSVVLHLRLSNKSLSSPLAEVDAIIAARKEEADEFYKSIHPPQASDEEKMIQRQALAGMIWSKQFYNFDVDQWLKGDSASPPPPASRLKIRNIHWKHLNSMRILSMPDKWEYPWFAAWDLAFHTLSLGLVDMQLAKEQLWLLLFDQFQHPNGAIPAYEWEFSDLNPPVQGWAAFQLYQMERRQTGVEDREFLKRCFLKLLMNFAFWVNRVDSSDCNVFEGGFLGLDNITIIDRSQTFMEGATLKQSDGTGWMAMFCLNLMRIALELGKKDRSYEALAVKFFEHFSYIDNAMKTRDNKEYHLWSEEDGFFYDVLVTPSGYSKFSIRSLVGLIPIYATEIVSEEELELFPEFKRSFLWFLTKRESFTKDCVIPVTEGNKKYYILTLVNESHLQSILRYVLDPNEFLSSFGIRSLSKFHEKTPFVYKNAKIGYEPAESFERVKGGNSNWRGPIWFPANYLLIYSFKTYAAVLSKKFPLKLDGKKTVNLEEIANTLAERLISIFTMDASESAPFLGESFPFAKDPYFKDHILFNEYFHGDTGKGLGASHQTGWTGLIANIIDEFRR